VAQFKSILKRQLKVRLNKKEIDYLHDLFLSYTQYGILYDGTKFILNLCLDISSYLDTCLPHVVNTDSCLPRVTRRQKNRSKLLTILEIAMVLGFDDVINEEVVQSYMASHTYFKSITSTAHY